MSLDAIAERYKNAGVFARCVVSDVRKLLAEQGDALAGFTVHAGWGNDGSADVSMRHDPCGWWLDDGAIPGAVAPAVHGHPFEGSASLAALVGQALLHTAACEQRQP